MDDTPDYERIIENLNKATGYIKYARRVAERDETDIAALLLAVKAIREAEALLPLLKRSSYGR